jgi:hypothetical protein
MYRLQSHRSFISLSSDVWIIGCVGNPLPREVARGEEHGVIGGDSAILEGGTDLPVDA